MKNILTITFLVLLLFSCKKSDIETPVEDPLKGKPKIMWISDISSERIDYRVDFVYDDKGRLHSMNMQNKNLFTWVSSRDSLIFRYYIQDEDTGEEKYADFYILAASEDIQSIVGLPNENYYIGGDTMLYVDAVEKSLKTGFLFSNTPFVSGLPWWTVNFTKYKTENLGFETITNYSYQDIINPPYLNYENIDTIRVEFSELSSSIPLPSQSYALAIPWSHFSSEQFGILINYFLHLSGYQIYQPYTRLPEKVYVNGILSYTVDYQQNAQNQVNKMNYYYLNDIVGKIEFEYY